MTLFSPKSSDYIWDNRTKFSSKELSIIVGIVFEIYCTVQSVTDKLTRMRHNERKIRVPKEQPPPVKRQKSEPPVIKTFELIAAMDSSEMSIKSLSKAAGLDYDLVHNMVTKYGVSAEYSPVIKKVLGIKA